MKKYFFTAFCITLIFCGSTFAQSPAIAQWKKAVVKIEAVQQRYTPGQVDMLLKRKLDSIGKVISQHETTDIRNEIVSLTDTLHGTGLIIADGKRIYLVTAKHIIRATELSNGIETATDRLTIKTDVDNKKANPIDLLRFNTGSTYYKPYILSGDKEDLCIISFQNNDHKAIVAYLKQVGVAPIPVQSIAQTDTYKAGNEILTVGFPALAGSGESKTSIGQIASDYKSAPNFTADITVYPGNTGGPIIANNKLIGILSYQAGISNNVDAATHPFEKANSAIATKAFFILPLLRKLQLNEKNPTFNK